MVHFVFGVLRRGPEAALLLLGALREFFGAGLQVERPFRGRLRLRTNLDLLASGLKPKHLDFHGVGSGCQTGEFIGARFIGGGHHAAIALNCDYCRARQRLAAKLDCSYLANARLRTQTRAQRQE